MNATEPAYAIQKMALAQMLLVHTHARARKDSQETEQCATVSLRLALKFSSSMFHGGLLYFYQILMNAKPANTIAIRMLPAWTLRVHGYAIA